jgi:hypothetical protein
MGGWSQQDMKITSTSIQQDVSVVGMHIMCYNSNANLHTRQKFSCLRLLVIRVYIQFLGGMWLICIFIKEVFNQYYCSPLGNSLWWGIPIEWQISTHHITAEKRKEEKSAACPREKKYR